VYLPLLSPAAVQSKWCELEINAAINLSLEPGRGSRPRIIPIIVAPCELPVLLRPLRHISFVERYEAALQELLKELKPDISVQPSAPSYPTHATPTAEPPKPSPTPKSTLSRDELVHLYNEARALQVAGNLREAAALFEKIGNYRDAPTRLRKIQLYLQADEWMKQALANKDDLAEPWLNARACLEELLQLDAQFLDARARLDTVNRWLALPKAYERLLDALDVDDWAQAFPLFEQIRSVKPNYKHTQTLFEHEWQQMVQARVAKKIGKDGKEMMYVPAGKFLRGEGDSTHEVYLDAFYIDRYPVTNAEYKRFVDATRHLPPPHWWNGKIPSGKENHPVVYVSWDDAVAYAQWAGKRLPTEAEWERAASWDDIKKEKRIYPWGNDFDPRKCNSGESEIGDTTPVGKYSPQGDSFYGVADMAGNVWEWCADWYDENYYKNSPRENPRGPASGQHRVRRGGSWLDDRYAVRTVARYYYAHSFRYINVGFRCVE